MSLFRDPTRIIDKRLRLIESAVTLPAEVIRLRERLETFTRKAGTPMRDRVAEAVIAPDSPEEDFDTLWALALAEAASTAPLHNDLLTAVRSRIHHRIREVYAQSAGATYLAVGELFDVAARSLTAAADTIDIESPAEAVVGLPTKQQSAWRDAQTHAATLSSLLPALRAAAVLAGICADEPDSELPLAVDAGGCHRRDIWAAWHIEQAEDAAEIQARSTLPFTHHDLPTRSRCGRWGAVLRVDGAAIRACPADQFTPYRRPHPLVEHVENTPGGPVRSYLDPEDPDYQPPPQTETRPSRQRITVRR